MKACKISSFFCGRICGSLLFTLLIIICASPFTHYIYAENEISENSELMHSGDIHEILMNKAILLAAVNIIRPIDIIWGDAMIQMAAGAVQEDDLSKLSWKHHFYRPIDNFRFFDIGIYDIDNAPERAHVFWSRMIKQLVDDPFGYYPDGGWNYVGRISHLLQDMSSPSHALAKSHAKIDYSCKYEQWYKEYGQEYIKSTRL